MQEENNNQENNIVNDAEQTTGEKMDEVTPESREALDDRLAAEAAEEHAELIAANPDGVVEDAEEEDEFVYVPKLTEKQQRMWQIILGLVCGLAIWWSLWLGSVNEDNTLFSWFWVIVFAAIMLIRRQVEIRTGVSLRTFTKFFLIGLIIFLGVYVAWGFGSGTFQNAS